MAAAGFLSLNAPLPYIRRQINLSEICRVPRYTKHLLSSTVDITFMQHTLIVPIY